MPDAPHGTTNRYKTHACRCNRCTQAANTYAATRRRLIAYGRWPNQLIPAHDAQQHIKQLRADGMKTATIAHAAGLPEATIRGVLRASTIRARNAQAILNVTHTGTGYTNHVDATGTRRRLQGLQHLGWSTPAIEQAAGLPTGAVKAILHRRGHVTAPVRDAITSATRRLIARPAPTDRWAQAVRTHAAASGYVPLMAWDDINDPTEQPPTPRQATRLDTGTDPELITRVWQLHEAGWTDQRIAFEVGYRTASAVCKLRARHPNPKENQ